MNVLLAVEGGSGGAALRDALEEMGHHVVGPAAAARDAALLARRGGVELALVALPAAPQVAEAIAGDSALPVVLVCAGNAPGVQECMARLPVFACLEEPVSAQTLSNALSVARARFEEWCALRARVVELSRELAGRKTVERAKGILMEVRGLSEGDAYRLLRRESQNRRVSLAQVASTVVSMEGVFRAGAAKGEA